MEFMHDDGSSMTASEVEDLVDDGDIFWCEECADHYEGDHCPTHDDGLCECCGQMVPRGKGADPKIGVFCRRCALAGWGCNVLAGIADDMDPARTLRNREMRLLLAAPSFLRQRMAEAVFSIVVEYIGTATPDRSVPWYRQCGSCGRALVNGACICRYCNCCSQYWASARPDSDDEGGRPHENCPECVGFVGDGVDLVIAAPVGA